MQYYNYDYIFAIRKQQKSITFKLKIMETRTVSQCLEEIKNVVLTGDPYADFAALGLSLHHCVIRYRRFKTRDAEIKTLTGRFDVGGKETTGRGKTYRDLVLYVASRCLAQREYLSDYYASIRSGVADQYINADTSRFSLA